MKHNTINQVIELTDYNREKVISRHYNRDVAEVVADKYEQEHPEAFVVIRAVPIKK
jgi:hypothetical protein